MFDFQKLIVYQKAKKFAAETATMVNSSRFDRTSKDQLKRASLSIMLNIAESSSRFGKKDRRNFLVIARGSAFECVAIFEHLKDTKRLTSQEYDRSEARLEEISKMLYSLIDKLSKDA